MSTKPGAIHIEIFGNQKETERWLKAPNKALGGNSPASLCKTEDGAIQVRRCYTR
ncbi:MbcA/ParS/Xre antitoxin family protein [Stutzerimonas stutzeri]|uniref:MbcA/ParS/Xre antitoxin family protein n=1 Tax=Stutzerimonas stutzeri TaxID=316 RepID=UPI001E4F7DF7|nr:MbcA/ParS/Xre antitoxin family protein [Stutzerimonas stutzeri]